MVKRSLQPKTTEYRKRYKARRKRGIELKGNIQRHSERLNSKWDTLVIPKISEFKGGQVMTYRYGTENWKVLL